MKIEKIHTIAANITYSGMTYNTRLIIETKHTGEYYFCFKKGIHHRFSGVDTALQHKAKGKKAFKSSGYYYIGRVAIPAPMADGTAGIWYINNEGDSYSINKVSKYAQALYAEMTKETINNL